MKDDLAELGPAIRRELKAAGERLIRKRAVANDALLASIVKDCNEAIFGTTLEGSVVTWNKGAERLYGYTASEILGGPVAILESPNETTRQSAMLQKLRCGEPVPRFETVHLRKNKSVVRVSLTISPVKAAHGRVVGTSTLAHDITLTR
jgi:PAS domain S-box-containing protein